MSDAITRDQADTLALEDNLVHLGCACRLATRVRRVPAPHVNTALLHNGETLLERSLVLRAELPSERVRLEAATQHVAFLAELKDGTHNGRILEALSHRISSARGVSLPETVVRCGSRRAPLSREAPFEVDTEPVWGPQHHPAVMAPPREISARVVDGLPTVQLRYRNAAILLRDFHPRHQHVELVLPPWVELGLGATVRLVVDVLELGVRDYVLQGAVAWRRKAGSNVLAPGLGVAFPDGEAGALRLLALASADQDPVPPRLHERAPLQVDVILKLPSMQLRGRTLDVSEGGLFVVTEANLEVGTAVQMRMRPPGRLLAVTLEGQVRRYQPAPPRGAGLQFNALDEGQRRVIRELLPRPAATRPPD
ncbi:MAG: PilZ domain-containing protein [Myxococcota bacterium]